MTGSGAGATLSGMEPTTLPIIPDPSFALPPVSTRDLLLGSGPRMARDAFGPMLAFYVGWRSFGLVAGIALSTAVSVAALWSERQSGRTGMMARMSLAILLVQATVGLVTGSEQLYLAQPVLVSGVYGLAFLVSAAVGRPLTAAFAQDMYPFPDVVRQSATYRRAFTHITLAWGAYLLGRTLLRLGTLFDATVEAFMVVNLVTGAPLTAALLGWSVWYAVRYFRRSDEWGEAIRYLDSLTAEPAADGAPFELAEVR